MQDGLKQVARPGETWRKRTPAGPGPSFRVVEVTPEVVRLKNRETGQGLDPTHAELARDWEKVS